MKIVLLTAILIATLGGATAQEQLNRRVDVTKDFTPDVDKASKMDVPPTMYDTVRLNPEIRYTITPIATKSAFGIEPLTAAGIATNTFSPGQPLFIRVGAGVPLNSLADIYLSRIYENSNNFGIFANHRAVWGKLTNELDQRLSAKDFGVGVGAFGRVGFGQRYELTAQAGFDARGVDKYGLFAIESMPLADYGRASYARWHNAKFNLALGNDMKDLSRFSFRLTAGADILSDNSDNREISYSAGAIVGSSWGLNTLLLALDWDYTASGDEGRLSGYWDNAITIGPEYRRSTTKYDFEIGADVTINSASIRQRSKLWIFPYGKIIWKLAGSFMPYAEARGGLTRNNYSNTLAQNPYILEGLVMPNTGEYNIEAGVSGSINQRLSYKATAGVQILRDANWFTNIYTEGSTNQMGFVTDGGTFLRIKGRLEWAASPSFHAQLGVNYLASILVNNPYAGSMPILTTDIALRYSYKSRLAVALKGCFETPRSHFAETADGIFKSKHKSTFNLAIQANYELTNDLGLFIEGSNLLGAKLYPYGRYVGYGAMATAGVTMKF